MNDLNAPPTGEEEQYIIRSFRIAGALTAAILLIGTIFYHFAEGWTLINSLYFSVTTLATVGFGDLTPTTDISKLFTVFYILGGIGLIATFANLAVKRAVIKRKSKK